MASITALEGPAKAHLAKAAAANGLTARGWTRTLRLARTIADLDGSGSVRRVHIAKALVYRRKATVELAARRTALPSGLSAPASPLSSGSDRFGRFLRAIARLRS